MIRPLAKTQPLRLIHITLKTCLDEPMSEPVSHISLNVEHPVTKKNFNLKFAIDTYEIDIDIT